jgi:prolyl-tRNA synthetase
VAELHHDDAGLVWPISVAPYQVHLVVLIGKGDSNTIETAERLYADLQKVGIEVLFDDRLESPGVKFNDADLIGIPIRLTVSDRAIKSGGIEFKRRDLVERLVVPESDIISHLKIEMANLAKRDSIRL